MNAKARWFELSPSSALVRALSVAASVFVAASCGESGPASPAALEPGEAALAVQPSFSALPPGGPAIALSRVRAVLTAPNGDQTTGEAKFEGGAATLNLTVQLHTQSAEFILDITAFDTQGGIAFTSRQRITIRAGNNNSPVTPVLVYAAPDAKVTTIQIVVPGPVTLAAGADGTLNVTGTLPNGQVLAPLVGWASRDPSIATVDANGNIKAGLSQGSTYIVATSATGLKDSVLVTVKAPVDKVVVAPATAQIIRGQTRIIGAELRDVTNKLINDRTPVWTSSDPAIASVSATGVVSGVKVGKATVTATSEGKSGSAEITVVSPLDHIEVTPAQINLSSLKVTAPLSPKLVPVTGGSVTGFVPTFTSSNPAVASVSTDGVVTSVGNGTAKITIEADGIIASVDVTVLQVTASVAVSPKIVGVSSLGETAKFAATALDAGGSPVAAPAVAWTSSDAAIATVTNGIATARRAGTATITATIDGKSDDATFVISPTARFLVILTDKGQIQTGQTATLTAKLADAGGSALGDATATYTTTTPNIASVSGNVVTGLSAGTAHIVGTAGSFSGAVDIKVVGTGGGGNQLVITPATAEKLTGGTQQFSVVGGDATFAWSVNGVPGGNATYGTITASGFYTAPVTVPTPATFDVCAAQASPPAQGCARVTINSVPTAGADVIVFNDINSFDEQAASNPNNVLMFRNLVNFTGTGRRVSQTAVLLTCGHGAVTCATGTIFASTMQNAGFTFTTDFGATIPTPIPSNVKMLILSLPSVAYSVAEINAMKQFSAEGGRILFIGEYEGFYPTTAIAVENDFFTKMGAVMRNAGNAYDCGYNTVPQQNLRPHQVTQGLTNMTMGCASEVILGPNDYPLYVSLNTLHVLAAVAKVDVTPLPTANGGLAPPLPSLNRRPNAPRETDPLGRNRVKPLPPE